MEKVTDLQSLDQVVTDSAIPVAGHIVDFTQKIERFHHRQIPPQLSTLTEHHADPAHMLNAVSPGDTFADRYLPAIRHQDSGQYLHRCALSRSIGSDVADKFAPRNGKRHAVEREDSLVLRRDQRLDTAHQARRTDSDTKGLGEIFDDDLRHGLSIL